jgi:hypothetical protein
VRKKSPSVGFFELLSNMCISMTSWLKPTISTLAEFREQLSLSLPQFPSALAGVVSFASQFLVINLFIYLFILWYWGLNSGPTQLSHSTSPFL